MEATDRPRLNRAALLLLLPVAADMVWLYLNPPAGQRINPFFLYLVVFGIGGLLVSVALTGTVKRLSWAIGAFPAFVTLALVLSVVEEVVAYATRSGIYQDGRHSLLWGLVQAGLPLFLWSLGVLWVLNRFRYSPLWLYVLAGLSGWCCEAIIGGFFFRQPALALIALPAIAYSYFVLIYLPYRSVEGSLRPHSISGWRLPAAIAVPAILWVAGGVLGAIAARGAGH